MNINEERDNILERAASISHSFKGEKIENIELKNDEAAELILTYMKNHGEFSKGLVLAASYLLFGNHQYEDETRKLSMSLTDKAVEMEPKGIEILNESMGNYKLLISDFPEKKSEIIRIAKIIFNLDPNNIESIVTLYAYGNRYEEYSPTEWIKILEKARTIEPCNDIVILDLAETYQKAKEYDKAISAFEQYITMRPESAYFARNSITEIRKQLKENIQYK